MAMLESNIKSSESIQVDVGDISLVREQGLHHLQVTFPTLQVERYDLGGRRGRGREGGGRREGGRRRDGGGRREGQGGRGVRGRRGQGGREKE